MSNRDVLLRAWIDEIRLCFHQLGAAATHVHKSVKVTGGQRGVLESLVRHGDQTVPQLARARPVSRQHIQTIVDSLADAGLVMSVENPAHKRSSLIRLTAKGKKVMQGVSHRESTVLPLLSAAFSERELEQAIEVTGRLRRLAAQRPWRRHYDN